MERGEQLCLEPWGGYAGSLYFALLHYAGENLIVNIHEDDYENIFNNLFDGI